MVYYHPKPVRYTLYALLGVLPVVAVFLGYIAVLQWWMLHYAVALSLGATAVLAFLGWLTGIRLAPFIAIQWQCTPEGLNLIKGHTHSIIPWKDLKRAKCNPLLQVLRVYHVNGSLVLAVDYHMVGFKDFIAYLRSKALLPATQ